MGSVNVMWTCARIQGADRPTGTVMQAKGPGGAGTWHATPTEAGSPAPPGKDG